MRATSPGEPTRPGVRRTPDELSFDIIGLARLHGRTAEPGLELKIRLWHNELRPTLARMNGERSLADPAESRLLAETAGEAFEWMRQRTPRGYRFVLTDAVYLEPVDDLDAEVVAIEAVVAEAARRGCDAQAPRLATSHVRPRGQCWVAGDVACTWGGPYPREDDAVAAVSAARDEFASRLRAAGAYDLAATAPRWAPVPVEPLEETGC